MSEKISADTTLLINPAAGDSVRDVAERPLLERLPAGDLARLMMGFYFVFGGMLLASLAPCQALLAPRAPWGAAGLFGAGCVGLITGAWRLHQVRALGDTWRRRTREALIGAWLLAYLAPFFLMWRALPTNIYMLGHFLTLVAIFDYWLALTCQIVSGLGRAAGKRGLVMQSILFGAISVVLLFPVFGVLAQALIVAARRGSDPLAVVQFWLQQTPVWALFILLLPFPLVLSLVWSAKELVQQRLLSERQLDETT